MSSTTAPLRLALVGNPNSGKTTVFNALTGARHKVANYPGVTVERREGRLRADSGSDVLLLDLPGTYSLSAHSEDERVACQAVLAEHPDVVVAVVDASNLARNLYLVVQLMELGVRLVVALNMVDAVEAQGGRVDATTLERALDIPVVPTVGTKRIGTADVLARAEQMARRSKPLPLQVDYGVETEQEILRLSRVIETDPALLGERTARWIALQLLGRDEATLAFVQETAKDSRAILDATETAARAIEEATGTDIDVLLIGRRYALADQLVSQAMHAAELPVKPWSERLDSVLTHRVLGLPIFLLILWGIFQIVFTLGQYPMDWIDAAFAWGGEMTGRLLPTGIVQSVIQEALFGGVAAVLVFLPQILLLFFCIGLLEDSGYMARAAFLIDRLMRRLGLHGKSLIPLLVGFGCNIPGIMAARTLDNRRDRLVTILVSPLMNCSARLTVHTLLAAAFFAPAVAGQVLFSIYLIGAVLAIGCALLFRKTLFRGLSSPFLMEIPPYRVPSIRSIFLQMADRSGAYLKKAGTILLAFSVGIWVLCHFPRADAKHYRPDGQPTAEAIRQSFAGQIGGLIAPLLKPIGLDNWKIGIALVAGTAAKEMIVATLGTAYSAEDAGDATAHTPERGADEETTVLRRHLQADPRMNPLRGYVLMVFVLLYIPCITTMAIVRRETNSWRWPLFTIAYVTTLAYVLCLIIYHGGVALGLGT